MAARIGYWIATILFCVGMGMGGYLDLAQPPEVVKGMGKLGYPLYFAKILGFWKLAGVVTLVLPGLPLLKEWAYAGFVFNLTGAAASHYFVKDPAGQIATPLVILAIGAVSWALRPACRRLPMTCAVERPVSTPTA